VIRAAPIKITSMTRELKSAARDAGSACIWSNDMVYGLAAASGFFSREKMRVLSLFFSA
jgi:hypothetical protein